MKIDSSSISFAASHSATTRSEVKETLRAWIGDRRPDFEGNEARSAASSTVSISEQAAAAYRAALKQVALDVSAAPPPAAAPAAGSADQVGDKVDDASDDPKITLIRLVLEKLTGHKIKLVSSADFHVDTGPAPAAPPPPEAAHPHREGWGIEYDRHEVSVQTEQASFQAAGVVRTSDGKEIAFTVGVSMASSVSSETNVSVRAGDGIRKDPLVINFNGSAAQLQSQRFSFDVDADGQSENIATLGPNSGYLALDLNGNGKIDSGAELFGAQSGNGFADLAKYDGDGNGWIDENDAVFQQLRVWTPDASGAGTLASIADKGVGALYLGQVATPFALKDGAGNELGAVRATGAYLSEDGRAGTLQQIDLVV